MVVLLIFCGDGLSSIEHFLSHPKSLIHNGSFAAFLISVLLLDVASVLLLVLGQLYLEFIVTLTAAVTIGVLLMHVVDTLHHLKERRHVWIFLLIDALVGISLIISIILETAFSKAHVANAITPGDQCGLWASCSGRGLV